MAYTFNFDAMARLNAKEFSSGFFDSESCLSAASFTAAVAERLRADGHIVIYDPELPAGTPKWKVALDGGFKVMKAVERAILNSWK